MNTTQPKTKTVESYFGPEQVTREEFSTQWAGEFRQFYDLAGCSAELDELNQMQRRITELAGRKWDDLRE